MPQAKTVTVCFSESTLKYWSHILPMTMRLFLEEVMMCLSHARSWGNPRLQVVEDLWIWSDAVLTLLGGAYGLMSMHGAVILK